LSAIPRKSPKLAPGYSKDDVRDAIGILEDMPRVPEKTPANSAAPGYAGAICRDTTYFYIHDGVQWKRATLSTF
jgi:hypothetical protein